MRAWPLVIALALALPAGAGSARAEELSATKVITTEAAGWGKQLVLKLDVFTFDGKGEDFVGWQDEGVSFIGDFNVDIKRRRARVRLGAGNPKVFSLQLDARMWPDKGTLRTRLALRIGVAGAKMELALPDVRLKSRFQHGQPVVEVTVPLIEGRF